MKKLSLIATLLLAVLLLQKCTKDTISESATSSTLLFAVINDTTWNADTIHATITYNSATNTKVFACNAVGDNKGVTWAVTQTTGAINTAGFPISTNFNADAAGNNTFVFNTTQRNSQGNLALAPMGTVAPGSGSLIITAIDSAKKTVTGTFAFTSILNTYDNGGNITSTTVSQISAGAFNNLPYTFSSK
jgi:hypothetical protein